MLIPDLAQAEIDALRLKVIEVQDKLITHLRKTEVLELQIQRLREVLGFYADPDHYRSGWCEAIPSAKMDAGQKARRILGI